MAWLVGWYGDVYLCERLIDARLGWIGLARLSVV
jgi:hypothetical protein